MNPVGTAPAFAGAFVLVLVCRRARRRRARTLGPARAAEISGMGRELGRPTLTGGPLRCDDHGGTPGGLTYVHADERPPGCGGAPEWRRDGCHNGQGRSCRGAL